MLRTNFLRLSILILLIFSVSVYSQKKSKWDFERIEDNSFFIEEAYNQDPGVIQHITSFQYMKDKTWIFSFTDEWPVPTQKHQLSLSVQYLNSDNTGLGDIGLNYRYQVFLKERIAFSPRISLLLPTGDFKKGLGNGVPAYQINLPFSFLVSRKLVTHYNLGSTFIFSAKDAEENKSDITNINYGASGILLLSETFNFMLEFFGYTAIIKPQDGSSSTKSLLFISPGLRYAFNFKSGLQIVPGLAAPIGIGTTSGEYGIYFYLSFEHRLWKP